MSEKNAIEMAKEALSNLLSVVILQNGNLHEDINVIIDNGKQAIAALEAEKPAEVVANSATAIVYAIPFDIKQATAGGYNSRNLLVQKIEQFARSYHERRMKEAEAILEAEPHGMIAGGMPGPMSLNAQLKRCEAYHAKECEKCKALPDDDVSERGNS